MSEGPGNALGRAIDRLWARGRGAPLLLGGIVTWLVLLVLPDLTGPFTRIHEDPFIGVLARRTLETGSLARASLDYINHPPLLVLLTTATFAILGMDPWVHRLLGLGMTLAAAWLLHRLLRRLGLRDPIPAAGTLAFLFLPMVAYYWRRNGYEPLVVAFGLAIVTLYLHRGHRADRRTLVPMALLALIGSWSDWALAFYPAALFVDAFLLRPDRARRITALTACTAGATGVLTFLALAAFVGDGITPLIDILIEEPTSDHLGLVLGLAEIGHWTFLYFTAIGVAAFVWAWVTILAPRQGRARTAYRDHDGHAALFLLTLPAVLNVALFWDHATNHPFWTYSLAPAVALALALGLDRLRGWGQLGPRAATAILVTLLAGGLLQAAFIAYTTDHPAGIEALEAVADQGAEGDRLFLAFAAHADKATWVLEPAGITVGRWTPGTEAPTATTTTWVLVQDQRAPAGTTDALIAAGFETVDTFVDDDAGGTVRYHLYRGTLDPAPPSTATATAP